MVHQSIKKVLGTSMALILCFLLLFTMLPLGAVLAGAAEGSDFTIEDLVEGEFVPGQLCVLMKDGIRLSKEELQNPETAFPGIRVNRIKDSADVSDLLPPGYEPKNTYNGPQSLLLELADDSNAYLIEALHILDLDPRIEWVGVNGIIRLANPDDYFIREGLIDGEYVPGILLVGIKDNIARMTKEEIQNYENMKNLFPGVEFLRISDLRDLTNILPEEEVLKPYIGRQILKFELAYDSKEYMLEAMLTLRQNPLAEYVVLAGFDKIDDRFIREGLIDGAYVPGQLVIMVIDDVRIPKEELNDPERLSTLFPGVEIVSAKDIRDVSDMLPPDVEYKPYKGPQMILLVLAEDSKEYMLEAMLTLRQNPLAEYVGLNGIDWEDAISIPTNVEAYAGNKKIALRWNDPDIGSASAFEIRVDNGSWINYSISSLTVDAVNGKWVQLFGGLTNGVEYTFQIRALDSAGSPSPAVEVKAEPVAVGDIGGDEADLISIHGVNVIPQGGWPVDINTAVGFSTTRPYELTMELDATLNYSSILPARITLSEDAVMVMYDHYDWKVPVKYVDRLDKNQEWKEETHVYLIVTSANTQNMRYYDITVTIPVKYNVN